MTYTNLTDDQASAQRLADRGYNWIMADWLSQPRRHEMRAHLQYAGDTLCQSMHDRDRFQRERDYWREQCIDLTGGLLS